MQEGGQGNVLDRIRHSLEIEISVGENTFSNKNVK